MCRDKMNCSTRWLVSCRAGNMCLEWLWGKLPVAAGAKAMLLAFYTEEATLRTHMHGYGPAYAVDNKRSIVE